MIFNKFDIQEIINYRNQRKDDIQLEIDKIKNDFERQLQSHKDEIMKIMFNSSHELGFVFIENDSLKEFLMEWLNSYSNYNLPKRVHNDVIEEILKDNGICLINTYRGGKNNNVLNLNLCIDTYYLIDKFKEELYV